MGMIQLNVLLVEDSEDDAWITLHELDKRFEISSARVETAAQMESALAVCKWDLVLADYTVPGFGALPALALLKKRGLDIPFIVVTGTIDEETAVAVMKAGANDYVMKGNLKRLVPAVERELREAARRRERAQAEAERKRMAARLATIVEMLPDIFFIKDLRGKYQMINSAFEKFIGLPRTEIIGKGDAEIFPEKVAKRFLEMQHNVIGNKEISRTEEQVERESKTVYFDALKVPLLDISGIVTGMVGISRDITEKKNMEIELQHKILQLQSVCEQTITLLADAAEAKDAYTSGHQKRVAALAAAIGQTLGLPVEVTTGLKMAALVHDIGKLKIPGEILCKTSKLSVAEFALIKMHPEAGYEILKGAELPWNLAEIIYQHHERLDGSGYPRGLKNGEILLESKIIAVADVVEAMSGHRPYRPALGVEKAVAEIASQRGVKYDPEVVDACITLFREKGFQFSWGAV
jgi:PAS domain S-box-containing protein/putative nucleotidyltransferase with HDIG domain